VKRWLSFFFGVLSFSFANVFVVVSDFPTGYPKEKKIGRYYMLDTFDDYHRALLLAEEVKARTKRDVYVGNFKTEEDFRKWLRLKNESYLRACLEKALQKDYLSYPNFNQKLFKEDLKDALRELKARERANCEFSSLTDLAEILEDFGEFSPKVKLIAKELRRYLDGAKKP